MLWSAGRVMVAGLALSAAWDGGSVRPGLEVFLEDVPAGLRGKRIGFITNQSGIDSAGRSGIDLLAAHGDLKLVALLAPERGIRGDRAEGAKIIDEIDDKTGVPIYSLYLSEDRGPTPAMLENLDVLVYDLQAAARKGIPFKARCWIRNSNPSSGCSRSRRARPDRRRTGDDVQCGVRARSGPHSHPRGGLDACGLVRPHRSRLGEPVAESSLTRCVDQLSR